MRTLAFLAVIALLFFATSGVAKTKIGLLLPYSGVYASLGEEITDGFLFGLEQANRQGEFEIFRENTEIKPAIALAKARKLAFQDKVDVITGIVSSGVLGGIRNFVHTNNIPVLVANASNDHATGKDCSAYITRISFSSAQLNRPMGRWMAEQGVSKVYTLAPDYAAGHQMIEAFRQTFVDSGGEIAGEQFTPFGKTQDFGPYLATAKASGADAIYVFYSGGEAVRFIKQYDSFRIGIPLYGTGFVTSSLHFDSFGDAADGVITALHYVQTLETPENKRFVEQFIQRFDRNPSEFAVLGYDAAKMIMAAADAGASDRAGFAELLPKVNYTGPRGPLRIDPATNNVIQNIYVYKTIKKDDGYTQVILDTFPAVQDPPNGCVM